MATKKKTIMEKLGLEPVRKLNRRICQERVKFLRRKIQGGAYDGKLLDSAKYYASWYAWMGKNGGNRSKA